MIDCRRVVAVLLCGLLLALPACGMLSQRQTEQAHAAVDAAYADGEITQAQRDAAHDAIARQEPYDWSTLGLVGANILLALLGAPMIVRLQRGPNESARQAAARQVAL